MKFLDYVKRYKWIVVGLLVLVFIAVSAVFGVHYYQYRSSIEYSFGKLQAALTSANLPTLATTIDFRRIAHELARETAATFPFYAQGPHQIDRISNSFQGTFLELLKTHQENEDARITDPEELLKKTFYALPPDVVPQMVANASLQKSGATSALLVTSFEHPLLRRKIPLVFRLRKGDAGWLVTDLVNAHDVVTGYRTLMEERLREMHERRVQKTEATLKEMHKTMEIRSCTANAGLISDHSTLMVVVHLLAHNTTGLTVKNVNAATSLTNAHNELVLFRNLQSTEQIPPASDFSHRWTIELDARSPEGQRVLSAGPLSCSAVWRTITMSNARVYHAETPNKNLDLCTVHKDKHPAALCTMPIFSTTKETQH